MRIVELKTLRADGGWRPFSLSESGPDAGLTGPRLLNPGFAPGMRLERTLDAPTLNAIVDQMMALRDGLGPDRELMLDVNFSCRTEWLRRSARAIVDAAWNGFAETVRIASMAEAFEVNVAPHNFNGPLGELMSAHFCAAVGNIAIMEIEADDVPWKYSLITRTPQIKSGQFPSWLRSVWGCRSIVLFSVDCATG